MAVEEVSCHNAVTVIINAPVKKKKKWDLEWEANDLPTVPLILNTQKVEAHHRLAVYLQAPKKANQDSHAQGPSAKGDQSA